MSEKKKKSHWLDTHGNRKLSRSPPVVFIPPSNRGQFLWSVPREYLKRLSTSWFLLGNAHIVISVGECSYRQPLPAALKFQTPGRQVCVQFKPFLFHSSGNLTLSCLFWKWWEPTSVWIFWYQSCASLAKRNFLTLIILGLLWITFSYRTKVQVWFYLQTYSCAVLSFQFIFTSYSLIFKDYMFSMAL